MTEPMPDYPGLSGDHPLVIRRDAAQATRDEYWERPLKLGRADCVRMLASHLRRMGYAVRLPPKGSYRTVKAAQRKLAERGRGSVGEELDAMGFDRIAPAATIVGDVVQLPSDTPGLDCMAIALGNGRVLGYCPELAPGGAAVMQPSEWIAAWRVPPKGGRTGMSDAT